MEKYKNYKRKKIDYEDDFVIVFDEDGSIVYKGIEDYEPMNREDWKWNAEERIYTYKNFIKIGIDVKN